MNNYKIYLLSSLLCFAYALSAQNPYAQEKQIQFGIGFTLPILQNGFELERSRDLRDEGLSYYQNSQGDRANVGSYPSNKGINITLGFYKPLKKVDGLMWGGVLRMAMTGSEPEEGGYSEAFYFNFFQINAGLKYYPLEKAGFYSLLDVGPASVLTKDRFINESGDQNFFHQFGVGLGGSVGVGYEVQTLKNKENSLDLQLVYQQMRTRVEVYETGDDNWNFGALSLNIVFSI
ncbi:MAG: hypothetical protein RIM99_04640 [Cyclobacteriaceae bacterium]